MDLKVIAKGLDTDKAQVNLLGEDKLYLVSNGVLYEVPTPEYGNMEVLVVDNKVVDIDCKIKMRVPGRKQRDRKKEGK